ncbi:MAG: hypothetical protein HC929_00265 [Leptolyngbyaceae cyanobacterium SM2_5_2]|nr:hypothetical protein [Leptolyngbyaceae cyanobacterium SM2_5_2]
MIPPGDNDSNRKKSAVEKSTISIDAGTLVLIISLLILVPLLLTGFISQ